MARSRTFKMTFLEGLSPVSCLEALIAVFAMERWLVILRASKGRQHDKEQEERMGCYCSMVQFWCSTELLIDVYISLAYDSCRRRVSSSTISSSHSPCGRPRSVVSTLRISSTPSSSSRHRSYTDHRSVFANVALLILRLNG